MEKAIDNYILNVHTEYICKHCDLREYKFENIYQHVVEKHDEYVKYDRDYYILSRYHCAICFLFETNTDTHDNAQAAIIEHIAQHQQS